MITHDRRAIDLNVASHALLGLSGSRSPTNLLKILVELSSLRAFEYL